MSNSKRQLAAGSSRKPHVERTLAMIKPMPQAQAKEIEGLIKKNGFDILERKKVTLSPEQAGEFYAVHYSKSFYPALIDYMTSGAVVALALSKDRAISSWRHVMGATNPAEAKKKQPSSVRALHGTDHTRNAVHGSDSFTNAEREIQFFFPHLALDPGSFGESGREYLMSTVNDVLVAGLTELCKVKPDDPLNWLADWLVKHNPNKQGKVVNGGHKAMQNGGHKVK